MTALAEERIGDAELLARNWRWLALRGGAALAFGLLALVQPALAVTALVVAFAGYAIANGVFTIVWAFSNRAVEPRWRGLALGGALSIALGLLTALLTAATALAIVFLIAVWAIVMGVTDVAAAIRLRRRIKGEWLLALVGVLSIVFGALLALSPAAGALAVVLWIGAYATVTGVLQLLLALRLRSRRPSFAL